MIRVIAAVLRRDEGLLICQRPRDKRYGGLWEFPGGKCEPHETDFDTATRELAEELQLRVVQVGTPLFERSDIGSPFLIAFVPVVADGDPVCVEHSAYAWVAPQELPHYELAPSDQAFVEFMLRTVGRDE